ncbi:MAG: hypothetical protein ACK5NL_04445 [Vibrio fluvialis]
MAMAAKNEDGGIWMIIIPIFAASATALDEVEKNAGSASALIGSFQYGSGIISTLLLEMVLLER